MGLFSVYQNIESPQITEDFLKELGFRKSVWGNPHRKSVSTMCWELYVFGRGRRTSCSIYYFPDKFEGYVTSFPGESKNRILGWNNSSDYLWDYKSTTSVKLDVLMAIESAKEFLKDYEY